MTPDALTKARGAQTQLDYARALGVSMGSLRNWEQGRSPIPPYVTNLVAAVRMAETLRAIGPAGAQCVERAYTF